MLYRRLLYSFPDLQHHYSALQDARQGTTDALKNTHTVMPPALRRGAVLLFPNVVQLIDRATEPLSCAHPSGLNQPRHKSVTLADATVETVVCRVRVRNARPPERASVCD